MFAKCSRFLAIFKPLSVASEAIETPCEGYRMRNAVTLGGTKRACDCQGRPTERFSGLHFPAHHFDLQFPLHSVVRHFWFRHLTMERTSQANTWRHTPAIAYKDAAKKEAKVMRLRRAHIVASTLLTLGHSPSDSSTCHQRSGPRSAR